MTNIDTRVRRDIDILRDELHNMTGQFQMALPAHIPADRFVRVAMTAIQNNPQLMQCERRTLWNSLMKCAQDGLLPDNVEACILPFNTKVKTGGQEKYELQAQYIPMIAGIRKKARNSGQIADWFADVIHKKDEWAYERGDNPRLFHKPNILEEDRGPIIAAYSVATFKDGFKSIEVMSIHEIERTRKASKTPDGPGWKGWFGEMAKKTVARRHRKVLPASTDLDDLLRRDDEVHGSADFADQKVLEAQPRPKLVDFTGSQPGADQGSGGAPEAKEKQAKPQTKTKPQEQTFRDGEQGTITYETDGETIKDQKVSKVDPHTGEVTDVVDTSAADAFEKGRKDREQKHLYPPRDYRSDAKLKDAWQAGWDQRNAELQPDE